MNGNGTTRILVGTFLLVLFSVGTRAYANSETVTHGMAVFNVKDFGATGNKADDARPAVQKAIEAAAVRGGTVYLPPGDYTSGTLVLRSHVNFYLEAGATLYASENPKDFAEQAAKTGHDTLFFGEGLEDIAIGGRGTIDGQQKYYWALDTRPEGRNFSHRILMEKLGKPQMRTYPVGYFKQQGYPHLLWLGRCNNVRITGLSWLRSPSWSFALYACSRVVIDGIYIQTSLKEGAWADGIDIVSGHDISISNSTIETGDDCIAISCGLPEWGPDYPVENVTISNCRLSSASAAIKLTETNTRLVRHILVNNCVIVNCNRGITLQLATSGTARDIVFSNITMDLHRYDWFWDGDGNAFNIETHRMSDWEKEPPKPGEPGPGLIRDVIFHDIIVHCQGTSEIAGHPERWLEGITFANIKFFISSDPQAPYDRATSAMIFRRVKNLKLQNIEVFWEKPTYDQWQSALYVEDVDGLQLEGVSGNAAWPEKGIPAIELNRVRNVNVFNSAAPPGTNVFLKIAGATTHDVSLLGNDFHQAKVPYVLSPEVKPDSVTVLNNCMPAK